MTAGEILIDARGLRCPEPVLRLRARLASTPRGGLARLLATDPLAPVDVEAYCLRAGHRLVESRQDAGVYEFLIERA